eukprot:scaffold124721_cov66-Phaeocystis_antarctica.AAC.5
MRRARAAAASHPSSNTPDCRRKRAGRCRPGRDCRARGSRRQGRVVRRNQWRWVRRAAASHRCSGAAIASSLARSPSPSRSARGPCRPRTRKVCVASYRAPWPTARWHAPPLLRAGARERTAQAALWRRAAAPRVWRAPWQVAAPHQRAGCGGGPMCRAERTSG